MGGRAVWAVWTRANELVEAPATRKNARAVVVAVPHATARLRADLFPAKGIRA